KLAATVREWFPDLKVPEREIGWVSQPHAYTRLTQQIAIRKHKPNGKWMYMVIVTNIPDALVCELNQAAKSKRLTARERAFMIVHGYDLRGGGIETQNKSDKQGLGLAKRN